jgi:hypothetical protein
VPVPPQKPPAKPSAPAPNEGANGRHATDELAGECQKLEEELEALKAKYEMYFLGVERREPVKWREELRRKVLRIKGAFTRNSGLRFRIQALHARYLSYERLWLRSSREKEEGTYRRDVFKARLHGKEAAPSAAPNAGAKRGGESEDVDLTDFAAPVPSPSPRPAPPAAGRPAAATAGGPRLADEQMRELYDAYIAAKRRCNEDVSKLSYEAVSRTVSKQLPELVTRYKAKTVDFKVVIKDGKAILKAIPRV